MKVNSCLKHRKELQNNTWMSRKSERYFEIERSYKIKATFGRAITVKLQTALEVKIVLKS